MANPHGSPIWYELATPDPDGAKRFYDAVAGWKIEAPEPGGPVDYRMIVGPGGPVGGVLKLDAAMKAQGAQPTWLLYVGVDDVDATVETARRRGAHTLMPAMDYPGVGRFALLADPQGAPFYLMRGFGKETSTVFARGEIGRFGWNELCTHDAAAALGFYGELFGWENRETLDMGPMGGYRFLDHGAARLGAVVEMKATPPHWNLYITVPDIDAAVEAVRAAGGAVETGPHEVPTGEHILLGRDPQGAPFALVAPARG